MNINSGHACLVLLCLGWKTWGSARTVQPGTVILHSRADDVVPFAFSEELVKNIGRPPSALIEVGTDHRLAEKKQVGGGRRASKEPLPLSFRNRLSPDRKTDQTLDATLLGMNMKPKSGGNGSSKFNILSRDMGGWVRVYTDKLATFPDDLPVYLSQTLSDWFRQRPQFLMRSVVPIQRDGNTVELHAWYNAHLSPALQGPVPAKGKGE